MGNNEIGMLDEAREFGGKKAVEGYLKAEAEAERRAEQLAEAHYGSCEERAAIAGEKWSEAREIARQEETERVAYQRRENNYIFGNY
jgi:hypothetical protein